jgi:hypothetical protein
LKVQHSREVARLIPPVEIQLVSPDARGTQHLMLSWGVWTQSELWTGLPT